MFHHLHQQCLAKSGCFRQSSAMHALNASWCSPFKGRPLKRPSHGSPFSFWCIQRALITAARARSEVRGPDRQGAIAFATDAPLADQSDLHSRQVADVAPHKPTVRTCADLWKPSHKGFLRAMRRGYMTLWQRVRDFVC